MRLFDIKTLSKESAGVKDTKFFSEQIVWPPNLTLLLCVRDGCCFYFLTGSQIPEEQIILDLYYIFFFLGFPIFGGLVISTIAARKKKIDKRQ